MEWGPGHDGSVAADCATPQRLAVELLRDASATPEFTPDDFDCPRISTWRPAPGAQVAIPSNYTPTYAYPLIVWLCDEAASEQEVGEWLERISPRNYIALALRRDLYGRSPSAGDAVAPGAQVKMGLSRASGILRRVASELRLHPERQYVAGSGTAGRTAIEWLLRRPDWFAGCVAVDVDRPSAAAWRKLTSGLCRQRLLWIETKATSHGGPEAPDPMALRCLGLRVEEWRPVGVVSWSKVAARMNDWIMADIPSAIVR